MISIKIGVFELTVFFLGFPSMLARANNKSPSSNQTPAYFCTLLLLVSTALLSRHSHQ
jgi:hypothetical protein